MRGQGHFGHFVADEFFDFFEAVQVCVRDQSQCCSLARGARRAAYAVDVIFGIAWHVVVYHEVDSVNINASAQHIGRHQNIGLPIAKREHNLLAFSLFEVAADLPDGQTFVAEFLKKLGY
jgi:hypothetical protein